MQSKKQPAKKVAEDTSRPIGPDDPICPYFDRDKKACASPNCPRLHCPCKFWDNGGAPIFTTGN